VFAKPSRPETPQVDTDRRAAGKSSLSLLPHQKGNRLLI
jgi:hypothetical protein